MAFRQTRLFDIGRQRARNLMQKIAAEGVAANTNEAVERVSLLNMGDLTTETAAADLLECAVALTEAAPWRPLAIDWIGEGVLRRLLKAQSLPEALSQHFHGPLCDSEAVSKVASADIVCFLGTGDPSPDLLSSIQRDDLPIISCADNGSIVQLLRRGHVGWTFDRGDPKSILAALTQALDAHATSVVRRRVPVVEAIAGRS